MTVASDTSVASIFRPASGPRTPADASKKEGTGTFGMVLDMAGLTELQVGTYVLMDWSFQQRVGSQFEIALTVMATMAPRPKTAATNLVNTIIATRVAPAV